MTLGRLIPSEYRVPRRSTEYRVPREETDRLRQGLRTVTATLTSFVLMASGRSTCDAAPPGRRDPTTSGHARDDGLAKFQRDRTAPGAQQWAQRDRGLAPGRARAARPARRSPPGRDQQSDEARHARP